MTNFGTTAKWLEKIEAASKEELEIFQKQLRDSLFIIKNKKKELDDQTNKLKTELSFLEGNLSCINKKLAGLFFRSNIVNKDTMGVTDHAVLRYLERSLGFEIDGVRKDIINGFPDRVPAYMEVVKTGKTVYKIATENGRTTIVTIIKKKG